MYSELFPGYKGPPISLLTSSLEVVEGQTFMNAVYGDRERYAGRGVVVSGILLGFLSLKESPQENEIDFLFSPEGLECYIVEDISNFL